MAKINDITEKIESGQIAKDVGEKQINIFRSRIRFAYELAEDPTAYAMARGFDAVRVVLNEYQRERLGGEGVDFLIYLNRTAMIAQDD